jgi:hypothetical protein
MQLNPFGGLFGGMFGNVLGGMGASGVPGQGQVYSYSSSTVMRSGPDGVYHSSTTSRQAPGGVSAQAALLRARDCTRPLITSSTCVFGTCRVSTSRSKCT